MKHSAKESEVISRRDFAKITAAFVTAGVAFPDKAASLEQVPVSPQPKLTLDPEHFRHYIDAFNLNDHESTVNYIDNKSSWSWLRDNIPLFECPDKGFEQIYYFRWWTYRKHIVKTPVGFVITEFLPPVPWAGRFNTISCPAGHHFYEGRWIHRPVYLNDYAVFWFRKGGNPRLYSFWAADSIYAFFLVHNNPDLAVMLLPDLIKNYSEWEQTHLDGNGLFWQIDDRDGMEDSIGGSGYRPTINSYMYGDSVAIKEIADLAKDHRMSSEFENKARKIRSLVQERLWNEKVGFFETVPRGGIASVNVREEIGFVPWYFNLPGNGFETAWEQLMETKGFLAPCGITTAEQRSKRFMSEYPHECLWNGPVWPFATTQTLVAMANLLNDYEQTCVSKSDYFMHLMLYAQSHHRRLPNGNLIPWIDEDLNPYTGEWIARRILHEWNRPDRNRGKDYNHSCFCDLVITGLIGLRPRPDAVVEVNPLLPEHTWDYFCLDRVRYHGHHLSILYDKTGKQYGKGKGLRLFIDGKQVASSAQLTHLKRQIP
jgi:Mannosylglycerate hydrolase MGH1-like glycoside hydrolase domain/Glycosyl hydrolase family 65, C-terminal domain